MRRYAEAAAILPVRLRTLALSLPDEVQARAEEFRLRAGRPMTVLTPEGEMALEGIVEPEELETLCDLATEFPATPRRKPCGMGFCRCGAASGWGSAVRR